VTRIFDNDQELLGDELLATFAEAVSMDAAVGYFNLRGYRLFAPVVDGRAVTETPVMRILVGMAVTDETRLENALQIRGRTNTLVDRIDNQTANDRRQAIIDTFRRQLVIGAPRTADFHTLTTLREHLRDGRVAVKLYTERPLHGKMYLAHTPQLHNNPRTGYVGSSNLTLAGLRNNDELSVDVLDHDGTDKLHGWFESRWNNKYCLDITEELVELLEESWVTETPPTPYELYLKVCYHLSRDAREGVTLYTLSDEMQDYLLQYQEQAVQILARRVHNRGGAMLGDVVGLGKTITAVATASMLQRAHDYSPLIICPPNLVDMWNRYLDTYRVHGRVVPYSKTVDDLPTLVRFGLVILDESHTMRSDKRQDYQAIKDYIDRNDARVLLLTATPYNTAFSDVSNQLSLYLDDDADVGFEPTVAIRNNPRLINDVGGKTRTFAAFKKSKEPQDWSRLMGEHLVRRTRSYIRSAYAQIDDEGEYLTFANGQRFHFPDRTALPIEHDFGPDDPAHVMSDDATLDAIESLALPRNALATYWNETIPLTGDEQKLKEKLELSRGNLMGIIRTNFYKRLSSAGHSFLLSLRRHVDRNELWLYALDNGLEVPVGSPAEG
jgi:hypothetical protein